MSRNKFRVHLWEILTLTAVLLLSAFFRFKGMRWDGNFHLHPDERFLTMVETSIQPVNSFSQYFNTEISSLNPHNVRDANGNSTFPFFVYGTFPIMLVRYVAEWLGMAGYNDVHIVGRALSGLFDVGTTLVVFLIAREIFRMRWLPFLAALFYACAILPIQISHFFIVDNFATFFSALAVLFAVRIQGGKHLDKAGEESHLKIGGLSLKKWNGFKEFFFFGISIGLAAASKINTIVLAVFLPAAVLVNWARSPQFRSAGEWKMHVRNLVLAGVISFIVFRVFQPYAFSGPGFFGIIPNPKWFNNLRELSFISSGDSNYPPSIQWARRSFWFPIKNLIIWGLGLPVGVPAAGALVFLSVRLVTGRNKEFTLLWPFAVVYIFWQAARWNPTMRYFLVLYPLLAVMAAWSVGLLLNYLGRLKSGRAEKAIRISITLFFVAAAIAGAIGFTNIYDEPMTRIAASEWMYQHIPGAINLSLKDSSGSFLQPLPYPNYTILESGKTISFEFSPRMSGFVSAIRFDHVMERSISDSPAALGVVISSPTSGEVLVSRTVQGGFPRQADSRGEPLEIKLSAPIVVSGDDQYLFTLTATSLETDLQFFGQINLEIDSHETSFSQPVFEFTRLLESENEFEAAFSPVKDSRLEGIEFFRWLPIGEQGSLELEAIIRDLDSEVEITTQPFTLVGNRHEDFRGSEQILELDTPLELDADRNYSLLLRVLTRGAKVAINGSLMAKETDWDDALPLFMYGYNPFDSFEGIYASDINFQMYWEDDQSKLDRFLEGLYQADYFIITSSRQWGSVTQIPERYPLTSAFYRSLIGCEADDLQWCYRVAEPDSFEGDLGFYLEKTFQVNPSLPGVEFNSQFAEEAFSVYDHPKVFVFKKSPDFDFNKVTARLSAVDLSHVQNISIKEAEKRPGLLLLSPSQWARQKQRGDWKELFDYQGLINSNQWVGGICWYLFITLLGWASYPLVQTVFSGLKDKGFPLSKLSGLILWSFITWWGSSNGLPFTRGFIFLTFLCVVAVNIIILVRKKSILTEIKENWRYYLTIEAIALAIFLFFLHIRLGNPDLWHPYKGGEKPMDFAYLNAVIKSAYFPPYDPWYVGGTINYYYFGFILAGIVVKMLGIVPSIAYNLILPTFFSFTGLIAFSLGWNLARKTIKSTESRGKPLISNSYSSGFLTMALLLFIGNLGSMVMLIQGVLKLGIEGAASARVGVIDKLNLFSRGLIRLFQGGKFNYYPGDWYWIPSRAIPGNVITEFPYFTFLYGDPHAHMFAYPITLLAVTWSLSIVLDKPDFSHFWRSAARLLAGALIIGTLRPTNTWDYPVMLSIGCASLLYALVSSRGLPDKFLPGAKKGLRKVGFIAAVAVGFAVLSKFFFQPFDRWYGQAYNSIEMWRGETTPVWAYLIHWGLFLFIIGAWLIQRISVWLKTTPLSALEPFYRKRKFIYLTALLALAAMAAVFISGVQITIIAGPYVILLSLFILFDRNASESEKFIQVLILVGFVLTFMVEVIALKGDIGRMNTVFKFYLQAWTFLSGGSAFLLYDLLSINLYRQNMTRKSLWMAMFVLLCFSVLLFPLAGSMDKIGDRMNEKTPMTLDGMAFMEFSTYLENGVLMDLSQDYHAIRWAQENIKGTPVIVEANTPEYRWGSRFSIYTGLPSVVGWNWHQRQQRAINPAEWVFERVEEVTEFYSSSSVQTAKDFIKKYEVEFIVVGQLEQAVYPPEGLEKFIEFSGILWEPVYQSENTTLYRVKG